MAAVGICGTDLHQVKGEFRRPTPMVLGHEGAGVVEEVGDAVTRVAPGDEVVLSWAPSCGECAGCRRGRPATCRALNAAIPNGTLPDGTTGMSLRGETVTAAPRRAASPSVSSSRSRWRSRSAAPCRSTRPRCSAAPCSPASARCSTPRGSRAGVVGARDRRRAASASSSSRAPGSPVRPRSSSATRSRRVARRRAGRGDARRRTRRAPRRDPERAPGRGRLRLDAVGDPATTATALRFTRDGGTAVIVGLPAQGCGSTSTRSS